MKGYSRQHPFEHPWTLFSSTAFSFSFSFYFSLPPSLPPSLSFSLSLFLSFSLSLSLSLSLSNYHPTEKMTKWGIGTGPRYTALRYLMHAHACVVSPSSPSSSSRGDCDHAPRLTQSRLGQLLTVVTGGAFWTQHSRLGKIPPPRGPPRDPRVAMIA